MLVFNDLDNAQKEVSQYAQSYRSDDVWLHKWKKSKKIRNFYLKKVDSPHFPFKIGEQIKCKSNNLYELKKIIK